MSGNEPPPDGRTSQKGTGRNEDDNARTGESDRAQQALDEAAQLGEADDQGTAYEQDQPEDLPDFEDFDPSESAEAGAPAGEDDEIEADAGATEPDPDASADAGEDSTDQSEWTEVESTRDPSDQPGGPQEETVDIGPSDPETIESEYGIDLANTEEYTTNRSDTTHESLATEEFDEVRSQLADVYGQEAVDTVDDLVSSWKGSSRGTDAQTLEALARDALGGTAPIRSEDGNVDVQDYTDEAVEVYQEYTRVSRAFCQEHYGDPGEGTVTVSRGITMGRKEAASELFTTQVDNADGDTTRFETSVLSTHSVQPEESSKFASPVHVQYRTDAENLAHAPGLTKSGLTEGEVHVRGGTIEVPNEGVTHTEYGATGSDITNTVTNPQDAPEQAHKAVEDLARTASRRSDVQLETREGAERLAEWVETADEQDALEWRTTANSVESLIERSGYGDVLEE